MWCELLIVVKLTLFVSSRAELVLQGSESPVRPTTYPMNEDKEVCIVARPRSAILLQPDASLATSLGQNGQFSVEGLDKTVFTALHIQWNCHQQEPSECDTLWIDIRSSATTRGFFYANYTIGSFIIRTRVSYGPEGISYVGVVSPTSAVVIPHSPEGIIFELRAPNLPEVLRAIVCERIGSGNFQPSTLLEASSSTADEKCATVIDGSGTPVPYTIFVMLHSNADINSLTDRDIKIVFGSCSSTTDLMSEPLHVTGAVTTVETTSHAVADKTALPPADVTSPGNTQSPPTPGNTQSPPTPSATSATPAPPSTSSSQPTNNGHIASNPALYVVASLLLAVLLVGIGVAIVIRRMKHCRKKKKVTLPGVENPLQPPEDQIDANVKTTRSSSTDSSHTASTRASVECEREFTMSNVPPPEQHLPQQHSTTILSIDHTGSKLYNTTLLKQIRDNTGEIAQGMERVRNDTKELKIGQEQIMDQIVAQNLLS